MKYKIKTLASIFVLLGIGCHAAYANNVTLASHKPAQITYQIAHQKNGGTVVLSGVQSVHVDKSITIPVELNGYDVVGIVPVSVDGHDLPANVTQFNMKNQCSMTTDAKYQGGALEFSISDHSISCSTHGGIFEV